MQVPQTLNVHGIRVLTSKQLAECYESTAVRIKQNFNENRSRFVDGKHYISLVGDDLKEFKKQVGNSYLVANRASHLYLWTEKGALLHAKSLNTDKAWEVYDYLVDFYFRAKEPKQELKPTKLAGNSSSRTVVNVPENPEMLKAIQKIRNDLTAMDVLLEDCIRYSDEESFEDKRRMAADVVHIIIGDLTKFLHLKPKLVEKYY
ncbi:MAG: ORF6N domain-containing protein [Clostridiales bacterium]|nr:ORF6N domain-containing protein [Clostridiales bacterium]